MKGYRINVDAVLEHDPQFLFSEGPSPAERIQAVKDAEGAKANPDARR